MCGPTISSESESEIYSCYVIVSPEVPSVDNAAFEQVDEFYNYSHKNIDKLFPLL